MLNRIPVLALMLAAATVALLIVFGPASDPLVYQRGGIQSGEIARLVTAHFIHSDNMHLTWNVIALLILGGLLEFREGPGSLMIYLLAGIFSVDIFLVGPSGLAAYCGLSGVLNTLLAGVLGSLYREPCLRTISLWVGAAATLKIIVEVVSNQALLTHTAWPAVPLSHLYGYAGGILLTILWKHGDWKKGIAPADTPS